MKKLRTFIFVKHCQYICNLYICILHYRKYNVIHVVIPVQMSNSIMFCNSLDRDLDVKG